MIARVLALAVALGSTARAEVPLALDQAEKLALENNGGFVVTLEDVAIAGYGISGARGVFAPRFVSEIKYLYDHNPGNFFFPEFIDQQINASAALEGKVQTGMDYRLELSFLRDENDGSTSVYTPVNRIALRLTLTQPLLRNAWLKVNRGPIEVASLRRDASRALRQAEAERIVAEVELAYWALALALKEREVRQSALAVAKEQVNESRTQLKHGAVAEIDVVEAEGAVARRLDEIEQSNQEITEVEGRLRTLLQTPPGGNESAAGWNPTDQPDLLPIPSSLDEMLNTAHKRRPDLEAARRSLEAERVAETVARNKLWPALDLTGSASLTGFSATLATGYGTAGFAGPFGTGMTPTIHNITGATLPPFQPDPSLQGGADTMFKNWRFFGAVLGARLEVPLDNSTARAAHDTAEAQVRRQKAQVQILERQIDAQVVTAWKRFLADQARVRAAAEVERVAQQFLEGQRKRFHNGAAVSFDVLRAAEEVTRARITKARAQVSARIAQARLALAAGVYLDEHHIKIQ
jgi:outer membrane protein TolC